MERAIKKEKKERRHRRVKAKIFGTAEYPRLCVFRSTKHIYAQLVDDEKGNTLVSASDLELEGKKDVKTKKGSSSAKVIDPEAQTRRATDDKEKKLARKVASAFEVGKLIAQKALKKKIGKVAFDRGGYKYHGRVKAVAEGARGGGLKF